MNFIKKLFGIHNVNQSQSPLDKHNQLFIEKIIEILKSNPESFSARWFNGRSLDPSVRYKNATILIMIETGQILQPISPEMTKQQKETVKELVAPIVERDSKYLIENLTK